MSENCSTFALVMENLIASFQDLMVGLFAGMSSLAIILGCLFLPYPYRVSDGCEQAS